MLEEQPAILDLVQLLFAVADLALRRDVLEVVRVQPADPRRVDLERRLPQGTAR